jgi:hypothetical protein
MKIKEIADPHSGIDENTLNAEKKGLVKLLKDFDKSYQKHSKAVHTEINGFIQHAFIPLIESLEANSEFDKLEELMKKEEIPDFRYKALE